MSDTTHSILLIGHRGSGKSTLGRLLAERLSLLFKDVDELIAQKTGMTPDQHIASNEEDFRLLEDETLAELATASEPVVIAAGGGIRAIPTGVIVIWIDREGWESVARKQRTRLRPDIPETEEFAWMRETREPHYGRHAHYRLHLEFDCPEDLAADRLALIAGWLLDSKQSDAFHKTWIVAPSDEETERCFADARLFALAGVELRSDLTAVMPDRDIPWLASLRTPDSGFFNRHASATAFDCDTGLVEHCNLDGLEPRTLIISHHPKDVDQRFFDEMLEAGKKITERYPEWEPCIEYKFAPVVKSWIELRFASETCRVFLKKGGRVSFLPQGKRWKWMRAFRLRRLNRWNYVCPGADDAANGLPALGYFLPHAVGPVPEKYCGVIGDPVDQSMGDVWHRAVSLRLDGGKVGYLKIHTPRTEADEALYFLMKLSLHGLSVTAPLKCEVIRSHFVTSPDGHTCGNTLTFRDGGWSLTDTDHAGMRASLQELEQRGLQPGPVAVFGTGGVSSALTRGFEGTKWTPVAHVSAREGWSGHATHSYRLVVNASGRTAFEGAPASDAWIDLHYHHAENSNDRMHLSGRLFYEAQAMAQRAEWGFPTDETN